MFNAGTPLVMLHMFIDMIIGVVSAIIFVMLLMAGASRIAYLSVISLGFVILAGINGLLFLFDGQNDVNSFAMAVSFLVVLMTQFFFILYYTLSIPRSRQTVRSLNYATLLQFLLIKGDNGSLKPLIIFTSLSGLFFILVSVDVTVFFRSSMLVGQKFGSS